MASTEADFASLERHVGHRVSVVSYGHAGQVDAVAVECHSCHEVIAHSEAPSRQEMESEGEHTLVSR